MATELVQAQPTVMEILSQAVLSGNVDVGVIERLARLQSEMMDRDARTAFAESFAEFKRQVPTIVKDAAIEVKGTIRSKYAKLDQVAEKVIPVLLSVGITHRWKTRTTDDGKIFVTCFLRHVLGHEEEGSTLAHTSDTSGSMNALQGLGSTVSYLERYTFIASCGIVVKDQDDDGMATGETASLVHDILNAANEEEYKATVQAAKRVALTTRDYKALKLIDEASDRRRKELQSA